MIGDLLNLLPLFVLVSLLGSAVLLIKGREMVAPVILMSVGIILVGAVLVPTVENASEKLDTLGDSFEYDDYLQADRLEDASGSLELVTVEGKKYLHAKDVGAGTYTYAGHEYSATVRKADLSVFLLIGQSNAAYLPGVCSAAKESPVPPMGTCYYYGTTNRPIYFGNKPLNPTYDFDDCGFYSMTSSNGSAHIGGIDAPFAAQYYKLTGEKVMVINGAIGGTAISGWIPGGTWYTYAQDVFSHAWATIDLEKFNPQIKSYIWIQGEADQAYSTSIALYESRFMMMHNALISGEFTDKGKFNGAIISKVQAYYAANVAKAQLALAQYYSDIFVGSELADTYTLENGLMSDNLHYTQIGRNKIAVQLADCCVKKLP